MMRHKAVITCRERGDIYKPVCLYYICVYMIYDIYNIYKSGCSPTTNRVTEGKNSPDQS